jgi:hypothetical protein
MDDVFKVSVAKHELVYHKTITSLQVCNSNVRIFSLHIKNGLGHARVEQCLAVGARGFCVVSCSYKLYLGLGAISPVDVALVVLIIRTIL